ncbi:MAG: biopolymer transport protein TolR [Glaciecola sp.]
MAQNGNTIDILMAELEYHTNRNGGLSEEAKLRQSITVMGDSSIPYVVLKRIMQSCAQAGYTNISLAVENSTDNGSALTSQGGAKA